MVRLKLLVLVKITDWELLVVPTVCDANDRDVVDNVTVGGREGTVPVRETTRLAPFVPFTVNVPVNVPGEDPAGGPKVTL